jgi:hypothetical protein
MLFVDGRVGMDETETLVTGAEPHRTEPSGSPTPPPSAEVDLPPETPGGEDRAGYRQQRTVPYGALAEERARRKELQRELQNAVESQQRLQGRLDLLQELAQQQGAAADPGGEAAPEREDDPRRDVSPEGTPIPEPEVRAEEHFRTQLMHSVRDVMRERPDFLAAYQHARQARVSELCTLGYAPQEALAITFDNEAEIIGNAYANGQNPAQVIYDYAQRHGYRGGAIHRARGPAPRSAAAMSEAEKVVLAARGQAGSKSLSNAGGGAAGTLTLEALAGMSDEEFAEATKGDRWQKLLR